MQHRQRAITINYLNGKEETWVSDGVLHPETLCANAGQVDILLQQQQKNIG
jgi:hypothetical protein